MPLLTVPIGPYGPIIEVIVGVSAPRAAALQTANLPVPSFEVIKALIDTGASGTVIDISIIKKLSLIPTGAVKIHTPSTGSVPHDCSQYDIALGLVVPPIIHKVSLTIPVIEADFSGQTIQAIIGRDVISTFAFWYNGPEKAISLAF
jgi:predicted aspartyl protease